MLFAKLREDVSGGGFWKGLFPIGEELGKLCECFGVAFFDVGFFVRVGDNVVEFLLRAIGIGDELPLLVGDGVGDPVGFAFFV